MHRTVLTAILALLLAAPSTALADRGRDGGGGGGRTEVRAGGTCGGRAASKVRLRGEDGAIKVDFEIQHIRRDGAWRVTVVQEGRVAWRGRARSSAPQHAFSVERRIRDLPGADRVMVRGLGPGGVTCVASATLPG